MNTNESIETGLGPMKVVHVEPVTEEQAKSMSMEDWGQEINNLSIAKGWWTEGTNRNLGEMLLLAISELTEAYEEWRNGRGMTEVYAFTLPTQIDNKVEVKLDSATYQHYVNVAKPLKPEGFPIEIADCFIRLLDTVYANGINITEMIRIKHNYNITRPYRHGGKKS